jgi:phosphopantetheinyl transferase (holo-ACP synthase)
LKFAVTDKPSSKKLGRSFSSYGKAADIVFKCDYRASVSLSHEEDKAIAMVLLEKGKNIVNL